MSNPFWANIFKEETDPSKMKLEAFLARIPLFANLNKREIKKVAQIVHERQYHPGEYMFQKDHPGAAMFIIQSGEIKIVLPGSSPNKQVVLATLEHGSFLGELALLDDSPRSASAYVVETTKAYAFFRTDLNKLIESDPTIGSKILKELALIIGKRLKATNEQISKK